MVPYIEAPLLAGEVVEPPIFAKILENLGLDKSWFRCSYAVPWEVGKLVDQVSAAVIEPRNPVDSRDLQGNNCFSVGFDQEREGVRISPFIDSSRGRLLGTVGGKSLTVKAHYGLNEELLVDIAVISSGSRREEFGFKTVKIWNGNLRDGRGDFIEVGEQWEQQIDEGGVVLIPIFKYREIYVLPILDVLHGGRSVRVWRERTGRIIT